MLGERFQQRLCPVVPQLDLSVMQGAKDPGACGVERDAFHTAALRLEFGKHILYDALFHDGEENHFLDNQGCQVIEPLHVGSPPSFLFRIVYERRKVDCEAMVRWTEWTGNRP